MLKRVGEASAQAAARAAALDAALALRLNRLAYATAAGQAITGAAAGGLALVEVGLMVLLGLAGRRGAAGRMLLVVGVVYVLCDGLGRLWPRQRPFARLDGARALVSHDAGRSFPSRHVASGLAMAAIGADASPRLGRAMRGVAWLLGLSRVLAGLHYPSDVLGGALVGRLAVWLVRRALDERSGSRTR